MKIIKKTLMLSLSVLGVNAQADRNKELLASQCYEIAQSVSSLVASQKNSTCIDKLYTASTQVNEAGTFILTDTTDEARQLLDKAFLSLNYAQLNGCNQYIQISHSKFEVNKLKHLL